MKKFIAAILSFIMMLSFCLTAGAADDDTLTIAKELNRQGLLSGVSIDADGNPIFGLEQHLTRQQAATLLVKLLGAADEAMNGTWENGFTDVEKWAQPYVGYCYANGITSGMRADHYGAMENITASQFITFILKALGFSASEDFNWEKSWEFSDELGITDGEYNADNDSAFLRGDAARIMYAALCYMQNSEAGEIPEITDDPQEEVTEVSDAAEVSEQDPEENQVPESENEDQTVQTPKPEEIIEEDPPQMPEPEEPSPIQPAVNEIGTAIVNEAIKYEGYPYRAGGKGPDSFDCSGFCIYILKQCGYSFIAGSSQDLYNLTSRVSASDLRPGDLVFFKGTYATDKISHSGIYIGNGKMIHAGTTRTGVCIVGLNERYWTNHFYAYGRMGK